MPRPPRHSYLIDHGFYHVISRSINNMAVFKDAEDFAYFLRLEGEAKQAFPIRLFHYALLSTHFHFVLQTINRADLPHHLYFLKRNYTRRYQKKYAWRGPLWRERYRSLPIENEDYLAACGLYVEQNPVKAGICQRPEEYPYSSAKKYFLGASNELLDEYACSSVAERLRPLAELPPPVSDLLFTNPQGIGSSTFIQRLQRSS
jgi:putative transposase